MFYVTVRSSFRKQKKINEKFLAKFESSTINKRTSSELERINTQYETELTDIISTFIYF
jgi:hypothetical protein